MQAGSYVVCRGDHESGTHKTQEEASKEVNYMANQNRQGYNQGGTASYHLGGNSGYQQGGNFSQTKVRLGGSIQGITPITTIGV